MGAASLMRRTPGYWPIPGRELKPFEGVVALRCIRNARIGERHSGRLFRVSARSRRMPTDGARQLMALGTAGA
jgi:hypothetical protein